MNPSFSHIKMVAIDCDETLVRSDNTVSDYTVDVLHRLQQRGIVVTIATGRMYQTAERLPYSGFSFLLQRGTSEVSDRGNGCRASYCNDKFHRLQRNGSGWV